MRTSRDMQLALLLIIPATMVRLVASTQALLASTAAAALFPDCQNGPLANNTVCDTTASVSARAQALVAALTNEEKFNLTGNTSPGVPRLGLPSYQWWRKFNQLSGSDQVLLTVCRGGTSWRSILTRCDIRGQWKLLPCDFFPTADSHGCCFR